MATQEQAMEWLKTVKYPGYSRDIVSFGLVKELEAVPGAVRIKIGLTTADEAVPRQVERDIREIFQREAPGTKVALELEVTAPVKAAMEAGGGQQAGIPGVKHIVAVASGKGGVGKSTVAANLAAGLVRLGKTVGLCDCDLYGPSMGLMFGTDERPTMRGDDQINPIVRHKVRLMSMGFLVDDHAPVILRGPMVTRYTQQFLRNVAWGDLDILVLDLPPGTGDIQLTLVQTVALSGAVLVTTPQEVALIDARKAAGMFAKTNVKVLGLVENMSGFLCPDNGKLYPVFGEGGGQREAERLGVPLLARVPLEMPVRECGDAGTPAVLARPESAGAREFMKLAEAVAGRLA
jgi:ATP-binding protein involved in chromosome partitioning